MSDIDINKKYVTRAGQPVRILCTDGPNETYPVIGFIAADTGVTSWTRTGRYFTNGKLPVNENPKDLVEAEPWTLPPPPEGLEWHQSTSWTQEMLDGGYRPMFVGEMGVPFEGLTKDRVWKAYLADALPTPRTTNDIFFRTKAPIPEITHKGLVPLEWTDIKGGDEFMDPGGVTRCQWSFIRKTGVTIAGWTTYEFEELMHLGWKIRSVNEDEWRPCHKSRP